MISIKRAMQIAGPVLSVGTYVLCVHAMNLSHPASMTAAVTFLCAFWWCTEAIPIPATSIIPFVLFPITGILDYNALAGAMGNKFILLFMGGFMISKAAEKSQTHLRVAHGMIRLVGTNSQRRVIIGFLLATAFCSMWISNTATALIMLPVAVAVIQESKNDKRFTICLLLSIAYGSSIGGIATLIGTPPNGVFAATYEKITSVPVDFVSWLYIGIPISGLMLIACAALLTFGVSGSSGYAQTDLGPWTPAQKRVLFILSCTALLWITRTLPFGWGGWSKWLNMPKSDDSTVALLAVVIMFLIPSGKRDEKGRSESLLDWNTASDIPWGILLLFAGGLAIADAFGVTGLAKEIGNVLESTTTGLHPLLVIGVICFTVTFMTEVTSNTATATLLMPILAATAAASDVDPAIYMIPAAISASCAFMLPVATPPNAIVFGGSDVITIPVMARYGLWLNLVGVIIVSLVCYFLIDPQTGLGLSIPASTIETTP